MFDLSKLNESLKAGTDRVSKILGKTITEKVRKDAWETIEKEDPRENQGDCKGKLRQAVWAIRPNSLPSDSRKPASNQE